MSYVVLNDEDLKARVTMRAAIRAITFALREKANGRLIAPPRFSVPGGPGSLVFTIGGTSGARKLLGFRVYDTFGGDSPDRAQIVAVYDGATGALRGVVVGNRIGPLRTGAIGGVAIDLLARKDARRLAILGTGTQARTQLEAAACVRDFGTVRAFSPSQARREAFAREMSQATGLAVEAVHRARDAVDEADVILCATTSTSPVLDADWLKPGAHVTTMGGAFRGASDIDPRVVERSTIIATDSRPQLESFSEASLVVGTPHAARLVELSDVLVGRAHGRALETDLTLFVSIGLAGTEVVVADAALGPS